MKKKMLVVDDEALICNMFKEMFESDEVEIHIANDGQEALDYTKENPVDLVVSDIMMPKIPGTRLFYELRKINPFVQIIMMTGYPSLQSIAEMFEAGASDFIIKPFDLDKLQTIVTDSFNRIDRWKELRKEWLEYKKKCRASQI